MSDKCSDCGAELRFAGDDGMAGFSMREVDTRQGHTPGRCLRRQLDQAEAQRDDLLNRHDTLQSDIASAFGWDLEGEPFTGAVRRVVRELVEAKGRVAELEAVVKRLPKTADGVPVVPGMRLWPPAGSFLDDEGGGLVESMNAVVQDSVRTQKDDGFMELDDEILGACYSTRRAAEAAKEEKSNARERSR